MTRCAETTAIDDYLIVEGGRKCLRSATGRAVVNANCRGYGRQTGTSQACAASAFGYTLIGGENICRDSQSCRGWSSRNTRRTGRAEIENIVTGIHHAKHDCGYGGVHITWSGTSTRS